MTTAAILMATFNGKPWIEEQLSSILAQRDVDVSVVVSDDGSTDGTLDAIRDFSRRGGAVTVLEPMSGLGSPVRNFLRLVSDVDVTDADFFFLADQDDVWAEDKVAHAIHAMRTGDYDCYASDLLAVFPDGREVVIRKSDPQKSLDYLFQGASAGCTYALTRRAVIMIREAIAADVRTLPKEASHDWLIYAITRSRGLRWLIDAQPRIRYRQHERNVYGGRRGLHGLLKYVRLLRSGWYRRNIGTVAQYCLLDGPGERAAAAVARFTMRDRLYLARNALHFRRRPADCLSLAILMLLGIA